jgi:hypothetical protein
LQPPGVIFATLALALPDPAFLRDFFPPRRVAHLWQIKPVGFLLVKLLAILAALPRGGAAVFLSDFSWSEHAAF